MLWLVILTAAIFAWFAYDLPALTHLKVKPRLPSIVFLTKSHQEIASQGDVQGEQVSVKSVPKSLIQALLATEDHHFYSHHGVDFRGTLRAAVSNLLKGRYAQGGSTITQQLAKNLFLTPDRSLSRKIKEAILAWKLEQTFTKDEILSLYLNRVYLGSKTYGVDAAAQHYFGKLVPYLNTAQCAVIVGLLKAPSKIGRSPESLRERGRVVLHNMKEAGYLSEPSYRSACKTLAQLKFFKTQFGNSNRYFTDWILSEASQLVDCDQDLIIITTLELPLQVKATKALRTFMESYGQTYNFNQAAFTALHYDGAVSAMVGGYSYDINQFNMATQAYRQAGSTFKVLVYLAALEQGFDLDTPFSDAPYHNKRWTVNDFGWKAQGEVSLERALVHSVNTATVRLAQVVGVKPILKMAQRFGFKHLPPADLSISLGTSQVTLLELVAMMGCVASSGYIVKPFGILEIRNAQGKVLYKRDASLAQAEMVQEFDAALMKKMQSILEKSVQEGTGRNAGIPGLRVGGKTGTSQDFRDAWFIGYTPSLVAGVWMGNQHNEPMNRLSGSNLPAKLWKKIIE